MRKKIMIGALLIIVGASCKKTQLDQNVYPSIQNFQKTGKLYTSEEADIATKNGELGKSPENAVVPVLFDAIGNMVSNTTYNTEKNNETGEYVTYFTTLDVFKKVTNESTATAEYSMLLSGENVHTWVYDPYVKTFYTRKHKEELLQQKIKSTQAVNSMAKTTYALNEWKKLGNIVYIQWPGYMSVSYYTGHTGGIVQEAPLSSYDNVLLMKNTKTVEAASPSSGVIKRFMTTGSDIWNVSGSSNRMGAFLSSAYSSYMTSTARSSIANYQNSHVGEAYVFYTSKAVSNQWYCSKLQWKAYNYVLGIDIDFDGGYYVFPSDILNSSYIALITF